MKICTHCKEEKEFSEFHKNKKRADGYQHICKSCKNAYYKRVYKNNKELFIERNSKRREQWKNYVNDLKTGKECKYCGEDCIACLIFHHIDSSTKDFTINRFYKKYFNEKNLQILKDEIAKCVLICENCHRKIHNGYLKGVIFEN